VNRICARFATRSTTGSARIDNVRPRALDGTLPAGWVVLDYFDVIVHVMRQDQRERYDLEGLWGDAPLLRQPPSAGPRALIPAGAPAAHPLGRPGARQIPLTGLVGCGR
jgi:hypothetical protein